jgi:eukaryotic-like serine/threonine-protein kinase
VTERVTFADKSDPEISVTALLPEDDGADHNAAPLVGERFGKYLLVGELATGGMAEIFLAVHKGLEGFLKVVTLKRVLPSLSRTADFQRMFVDEARIAARLEHPNIVRTYEFGEHEGQYYTVMEYLAGEDLAKVLARVTLPSPRQHLPFHVTAGIASHLCSGLHFAHELTDTAGRPLGLVHRDVNPSNIVLTYSGEVKLIDFGVAKVNANATRTLAGTIKGKVNYMAPEQILARGVDRRSDVFSAGVVLWELLTGRPLFGRDSEAATLYAIMNDPIPSPHRYRPEVPAELEEIASRALSRTPADRFDTAEEMQLALDEFLSGQPKFDSRVLGRTMEHLFGLTRTRAKRSIAQTRALAKNISLVMNLRSNVRSDLAAALEDMDAPLPPSTRAQPRAPRRLGLAAGIAACTLVAGGLGYVGLIAGRAAPPSAAAAATAAPATLELSSTPPGAAVFIGDEPTGMKTPVTLTGLPAGAVVVRLELPGHLPAEATFTLAAGATAAEQLVLPASAGRLIVAGLPAGAEVLVDGDAHPAGELITLASGRHEVRVLVGGATVAQQAIDTTTGDQRWELQGDRLVRR